MSEHDTNGDNGDSGYNVGYGENLGDEGNEVNADNTDNEENGQNRTNEDDGNSGENVDDGENEGNGENRDNVEAPMFDLSFLNSRGSLGKEDAIQSLLAICAENGIAVPPKILTALMRRGDDDNINDEMDESGEFFNARRKISSSQNGEKGHERHYLSAQSRSIQSSAEELEMTKEIRKVMSEFLSGIDDDCGPSREKELRITNGSYTVTYSSIDYEDGGEGGGRKSHIPTVGNVGAFVKLYKRLKRGFKEGKWSAGKKKQSKTLMEGINLRLKSGKMYLILGAPGCGKSMLQKIIAKNLRRDENHVVGGSVKVNGIDQNNKNICWTNVVAYIDQIDRLHSLLTVGETCDFAWHCRKGGSHKNLSVKRPDDPEIQKVISRLDAENWLVNTVLRGMGILRVKDTFVGDGTNVRGVSGGEKKRVTVSEMLCVVTPVLCLDEMSTGLDAATTYDIVRLIRESAIITDSINIVSLLQPPPETVALFDELILLDKGRIIYNGPVDQVVDYFNHLGYRLPDRMDTADWLQALPTPDGANFLVDPETKSHMTHQQFVDAYVSSPHGLRVFGDINKTWKNEKNKLMEDMWKVRYKNPWHKSIALVFWRELLLWRRDKYQMKARIIQSAIMSIVVGTVFWQQSDNPQSIVGVLFQSLFYISLGTMTKIAAQIKSRSVFYKQQDANFFPTWSFIVGRSLAMLPSSIIDALLYGTVVYWCVGLAHDDGASVANFFVFLLVLIITAYAAFLGLATFSTCVNSLAATQAAMAMAICFMIIFSGFTVQPDVLPPYWIWVYWINIFSWSLRSLLVNEFQSGAYNQPTGVGQETVGDYILERFGYSFNGEAFTYPWVWYGILFCVGFCIFSAIFSVYLLNKIRFEMGQSADARVEIAADKENEEKFDESVKSGCELPFQKVNLTFNDVHYSVKASTSDERIELLRGISGYFEAGKMTALMGSSGAGKTTLMDVLSLRKTSGVVEGEILLNGHPQDENSFRRCAGYVEQFDTQTSQLTIRETVEFSAVLRLDDIDEATIEKFVDQTLDMLELSPIQDLLVGSDDTGGLSFEQRKRLSIAVELVANPSVIFLDEPTSGLDARAASIVMRGLRRIANSGRAVVATIHQPSPAIFYSFDDLLLLKRGGETVYFGNLGHESCDLIKYLEGYDDTDIITPGENPATWMLTVIGSGTSTAGGKGFDYASAYRTSSLNEACLKRIAEIEANKTEEARVMFPTKYARSRKDQRKFVLQRMAKIYWRAIEYNRTKIILSAMLSLLFGSIFAVKRVPTNESDMNSRLTSIYITALFLGVYSFNTVLPVFEAVRDMFYRHKHSRMYRELSLVVAVTVVELPFVLTAAIIFQVPFYFMVGFSHNAGKFFLYYLFFTLNMIMWTFMGQAFMSLFRDSPTAQGFGAVMNALSSLFTGVLIRPQSIPTFWVFMYWVMPSHYVLEGLIVSQFYEDDTPIQASRGSPFYYALNGTASCPNINDPTEECYGTAWDWVYISFEGNFTYEHIPFNILYLLFLCIAAKVISYFALKKFNYLNK